MPDDFEYVSRTRLEFRDGYRHAFLGDVPEPVVYGVQGKLREYYGVKEGPPIASTLDPWAKTRSISSRVSRSIVSVIDSIA